MGMSVNTPIPTIPVMYVDAVPMRAVGGEPRSSSVQSRPVLDHPRLRCVGILCALVEVGVQLGHHQLDRRDGILHFGLPLRERFVE
jgi:hypothetical protein